MTESTLFKTSLNKAMALCSQREYCISDILGKLESWGVNENDAEGIIKLLVKENFINEVRYSEAFVKDKFRYNKWGKVKIAAHLKFKSVPADIILKALECIDEELYIKRIGEILLEHRKSIRAKNQYELKGKLLRYGLSKGFESRLLYDILNKIDD
jgi:regulatory protein